jgi:hypothetical protein
MGALLLSTGAKAQIKLLQDYKNNTSATIGTYQGIKFREAGFSGLYAVPNTNGKEYWVVSDRGVNIDAANANSSSCRPTYDKIFVFPNYTPKIHRIRVVGDSIEIIETITIKRPTGTGVTGVLNPAGFGSTSTEVASTDTSMDCTKFNSKVAAKDIWAMDSEGLLVDKEGNFWICEENGPTIWKVNPAGILLKRYTPYANLPGAQPEDVMIDSVFKYRKNNRGFEGIAMTPNGKIYAIIQSPLLYPSKSVGENTRIHRILEINPADNSTRTFAYLNDGIIGSGSDQIRLRDWKIGEMAAINDNEFLVLEAALRGVTDIKRMYKISLTGATALSQGLYSGKTVEEMVDAAGLSANSITPVTKTLVMDLLANNWPAAYEKAEGLAIVNDSTIAIVNDNDFGQKSVLEDGIVTATGQVSHLFLYSLKGTDKIKNYVAPVLPVFYGQTGPSSTRNPYIFGTKQEVFVTSLLTVGDVVSGYKLAGLPDGLGAYDNGDGTFTVLMNHEMGNTVGAVHAHGQKGAFVSKWVIKKSDLSVVSGSDLIKNVNLWNGTGYTTYNSSNPDAKAAFTRFCSADLPEISAYYNSLNGKGTKERIFMNGEESGSEGRMMGHIATGANAGTSYELPRLGKFSAENVVASPYRSDKTIVAGMDDATPGQVYIYIGTKTNTGTEVEKAGLTNGKLYGVAVTGMTTETDAKIPTPGTEFKLIDLGNVENTTGSALNTASNNAGVTTFLRPEDGAWDPSSPNDFYFVTTNGFNNPSRLWRLRFSDINVPEKGGVIEAVLSGTEGQRMFDNMTIDNSGHVLLQEDVGGNAHNGKIWQYTIETDVMVQIAQHDPNRFVTSSPSFLTQDEEASGMIDAQSILGPGMFLMVDQAHYSIPGELVEGGQFLTLYSQETALSNPEIGLEGNAQAIIINDTIPAAADNTDFGKVAAGTTVTKTFVIRNTGKGALKISSIRLIGNSTGEFSILNAGNFPLAIAAGNAQVITIQYSPNTGGARKAILSILSNDLDESEYLFGIQASGVTPEIEVKGNNSVIADGTTTISTTDNTDFGTVNVGGSLTKTFTIQNKSEALLTIKTITISGSNASEFRLVNAPATPFIIPAGVQNFSIQFTPVSAGISTATVNITSDDADEEAYDFSIQGMSAANEIDVKGNNTSIADGTTATSTTNNTDFGTIKAGGSITKTFAIQNTGDALLTINTITISGTNASEFKVVGTPATPITIASGSSQNVSIEFTPKGIGTRTATVVIANDDANEASYDFAIKGLSASAQINVKGNEVSIANGTIITSATNNTRFGKVYKGSSISKTFVIENTGLVTLRVSNIAITGTNAAEFKLASALSFPMDVPAQTKQSFTIMFEPAEEGLKTATVNIMSDDAEDAIYSFAVAGEGLIEISGINELQTPAISRIEVFPNPAQESATLKLKVEMPGRAQVSIYDMKGNQVVASFEKNLKAGENSLTLNTSGLVSGSYIIQVSVNGITRSTTAIVAH